jgi:adenine phosphoribosyltransferase
LIRDVPDFPKPGVVFKDITNLLADGAAFDLIVTALVAPFRGQVDKVAAIEARGFILGAPAAIALGAGLVPLRKSGKLPWETLSELYELEYGIDALEIHTDALAPGDRVLLVDDVIATGGTARAAAALVATAGADLVGLAALLELEHLGGRDLLPGIRLHVVAH